MKTATATLDYEVSAYAAAPTAGAEKALTRFRRALRTWRERSKTRRALAELTPRMLEDVGLDYGAAMQEAAKPFWKA